LLDVLQNTNEDRHQAVLNVAYNAWQADTTGWNYGDMTVNVSDKLGTFAQWLVLIGKYNQQVCNGGHLQYKWNNYADTHDTLVRLTKVYGPEVLEPETYKEAMTILEGYNEVEPEEVYNDCYYDDEDEDEWRWDNQEPEYEYDYSALDTRYYKIDQLVLAQIEKYLQSL